MARFIFNTFIATSRFIKQSAAVRLTDFLELINPGQVSRPHPETLSKPYTLGSFESEIDLVLWSLDCDSSRGGRSTAEMSLKDSALHIEGHLDHHRTHEFYEVLYAEAFCVSIPRRKLNPYNGMRVQVKTDGHIYYVALDAKTFSNELTVFAYIEDQSKDWVTLELPLNCFQNKEQEYGPDMISIEDFQGSKLRSLHFGLTSPDQKEIKFKASLRKIELVYRPDFKFITRETLPRPVMVKPVSDYAKADVLDTGAILLKKD